VELRNTAAVRDNVHRGLWFRSDGVNRRLLTAEALVPTQRRPCGFVIDKMAVQQVHYTAHRLCLVTASPMLHIHSFILVSCIGWTQGSLDVANLQRHFQSTTENKQKINSVEDEAWSKDGTFDKSLCLRVKCSEMANTENCHFKSIWYVIKTRLILGCPSLPGNFTNQF
jgi:hypothetical protein